MLLRWLLQRSILRNSPLGLAIVIVLAILLPMGSSSAYLWGLGVILSADPMPVVSTFLIDGTYAIAPVVACCLLFWFAYLPIYAMVAYSRSVQVLTALRDEDGRPVAVPSWFPVPFYSSERWRLLIQWLRLHLSRVDRTIQDAVGALSAGWTAGVHPQIE